MAKETTAVEWLFQQLWDEPKDKFTWYALREKAKQMENERLLDKYGEGYDEGMYDALNK